MKLLWVVVGLVAVVGLVTRPMLVVRVLQQNDGFVESVEGLNGGQELVQGLQNHLSNMLSYMKTADVLFMVLLVLSVIGILLHRGNKKARSRSGDQACCRN